MKADSVDWVMPRLVGPPGSFGSLVKPPSNCRMNFRHLSKFAAAIIHSSLFDAGSVDAGVDQLTRGAPDGGGSGSALMGSPSITTKAPGICIGRPARNDSGLKACRLSIRAST